MALSFGGIPMHASNIPSTGKKVYYVLKHALGSHYEKYAGAFYFNGEALSVYASPASDVTKARRFNTIPEIFAAIREAPCSYDCEIVRVTETTTTIPGKETRTVISEQETRVNNRGNVMWAIRYTFGQYTRFATALPASGASSLTQGQGALLFNSVLDAAEGLRTFVSTRNCGGAVLTRTEIVPVLVEKTPETTDTQIEITVLA